MRSGYAAVGKNKDHLPSTSNTRTAMLNCPVSAVTINVAMDATESDHQRLRGADLFEAVEMAIRMSRR